MKSFFTAAVIVVCSSTTALAEDCTPVFSFDQIVGSYKITNGPGQLINVPNIGSIPVPAQASLTAEFTKNGDALWLDSKVYGSLVIDFGDVSVDDERWSFDQNDTFLSASSEDIAIALSCEEHDDLMRLVGSGTTDLGDAGIKPVTMHLMVFAPDLIIGRMDILMTEPSITMQTKIYLQKID